MADLCRWIADDGRVVLWQRDTGRHVQLAPESLDRVEGPQGAALRRRLESLDLRGEPDLLARIPCRHRHPLLLPDQPALWHPVPEVHAAGGHGWTALPITAPEVALWLSFNGARTLGGCADRVGVSSEAAVAFTRRLTDPAVQALQLRRASPRPGDPTLGRIVAPARAVHDRPPDRYGLEGQTTLTAWHLAIPSGERHFDDVETTVAHALGRPHPALAGVPFGARLRAALSQRGWTEDGWTAEIGCGSGELASAWAAPRYVRVDLSPALLTTQAITAPGSFGVCANGTALPFRAESIHRIVCNEVIADLEAVPVGPDTPAGPRVNAVRQRIVRHAIDPWPERAWYNLGAWQLVEEFARVLRPGGRAYVSEFGDDNAPAEATQLDHPEVAIHFGQLARVAESVGLEATRVGLDALLGVDLQAPQLARAHYMALRALAAAEGWQLDARAWTPETLALPRPVHGIRWVPQTDEGPGPLVTRFEALLLHKPD
ncbi:MAG: SAM-dependent methyltransferase [Myxococcota bacterium]